MSALQPVQARQDATLQADLRDAQRRLQEAESELAQEQAAVNRFRMHSRLMLDDLADEIQGLLADKQLLLTELQLRRQDQPPTDDAPPHDAAGDDAAANDEAELLLPTPTPRDKAAEKRLYRELARRFHPDKAESSGELAYRTSMMAAVNVAYAAGDLHSLYDLAGELEPEERAELSAIEAIETRRVRERLLQMQRRRRKVLRQLEMLRRESVARLWRKALELEEGGQDWWTPVRRDLETARTRLQEEVAGLRAQLDHEREG